MRRFIVSELVCIAALSVFATSANADDHLTKAKADYAAAKAECKKVTDADKRDRCRADAAAANQKAVNAANAAAKKAKVDAAAAKKETAQDANAAAKKAADTAKAKAKDTAQDTAADAKKAADEAEAKAKKAAEDAAAKAKAKL